MIVSEKPLIRLHNSDCMPALEAMEENQYDLAICDPPYSLGINGALNVNSKNQYIKGKDWDNKTPNQKYFDKLKRASNEQIIWGWNYMTDKLPPSKAFIYWNKLNHHSNRSAGELAYYSGDLLARHFEYMWDGNRFGFKGAKVNGVGKPSVRIHPTQKPVALYKWLLKNYAKEGDTILDTHGGSMSIAIAAYDLGFDLDLWELDKDYYEAGVKRVQKHIAQGQLFNPAQSKEPGKQLEI